jgi:hypothetical protein
MSEGMRRMEQEAAQQVAHQAHEQRVADEQRAFEEHQEQQRAQFAEHQAQRELAMQQAERERAEWNQTQDLERKDQAEQADREHREQVARRLAGANLPTTEGGHRTPNDEAEIRIYGERTTMEPKRDSYTGQTVMVEVNKRGPSKRDEILAGKKYGDTPAKREAIADRYMKDVEVFVDGGLELSQAEMIANRGIRTPDRINEIAGKMLSSGRMDRKEAFKKATALVEASNRKFADTIRREGIVTEAQYEQYKDGTLNDKKEEEPTAPAPKPEEPKGPEGGNGGNNGGGTGDEAPKPPTPPAPPAGPRLPEPLPGPGKPGENGVPPLLEQQANMPLEDALENANRVARWFRGHPSGKMTNGLKYALGGLKKKNRDERAEVKVLLGDDTSTLNEKLQGLNQIGAYQTELLLKRAFRSGNMIDLSEAKDLKDVKRIVDEAQVNTTVGDAVREHMGGVPLATSEGGNREVSEAKSRANHALIRQASIDQIADPAWLEANGLTEENMSPANMSLYATRAREIDRVRAAQQAASGNGPVSPSQRRPGRRERRAAEQAAAAANGEEPQRRRLFGRRSQEQQDAGLDIVNGQPMVNEVALQTPTRREAELTRLYNQLGSAQAVADTVGRNGNVPPISAQERLALEQRDTGGPNPVGR